MKKARFSIKPNLILIITLWLFLLIPAWLFADGVTSDSMQVMTGAREKVFTIDKAGNLLVRGKISQRVSPIAPTSQTDNLVMSEDAQRKFLLQISEKGSGKGVGDFHLTGAINSETSSPQSTDYIKLVRNGSGSPNAVFKKNGDLLLTGQAYEYVANPDTFAPEAGAVQFQFARYEAENTTNARVVVNIVRTGRKQRNISVQYRSRDESAQAGVHYQGVSGALNIAVGDSVSSFTVPIIFNPASTTSRSLEIELLNPGGGCRLGLISRVQMVINALPPDPSQAAPTLAENADPDFRELTRFLYQSTDYAPLIQSGMTSGTITAEFASVIRGRVYQANVDTSAPLAGVRVSVLDHPEYGHTLSRADGLYDLAVNGGSPLTLSFEKAGYLRSQRRVTPQPRDYSRAPTLALIKPSTEYYFADLLNNRNYAPIRMKPVTDRDGTRQGTLLFQPNTKAQMIYAARADGSTSATVPLSTFNFYVNEFTVGKMGPAAMPAELDPQVEYTYCSEFSVLEAEAAGAKMVRFDKPVIHYMNNFIGFPVGSNIPSGSYFRDSVTIPNSVLGTLSGGRWIPESNGRVIKILRMDQATTRSVAVVDAMGNGQPTPMDELAPFGITQDELYELAANFKAGDELWRVPIEHFTYSHDSNYNVAEVKSENQPENVKDPLAGAERSPLDSVKRWGEINTIEQTLHESISIPGTPYSLNYVNERSEGRKLGRGRTFIMQLMPDEPSPLPTSITCQLQYAGRVFETTFKAPQIQPGLKTVFSLDGVSPQGAGNSSFFGVYNPADLLTTSTHAATSSTLIDSDIFGYRITKQQRSKFKVGYTYPVVYATSQASFDRFVERYANIFSLFPDPNPDPLRAAASGASAGALLATPSTPASIIYRDPSSDAVFILSRQQTRTYWFEQELDIPPAATSANGDAAFFKNKTIGNWSLNVHHFYDAESKTIHLGDGGRYQASNGFLVSRNLGDQRALATHLPPYAASRGAYLRGMDAGPDGTIYAADGLRVYKIKSLDEEHAQAEVFAGSGAENEAGDGGSPLSAGLLGAVDVAVVSDDVVYVAQTQQIRKIAQGKISTVAFRRNARYPYYKEPITDYMQYDGKMAIDVDLGGKISRMAAGPDGSLYVLTDPGQIFRVDPAGRFYYIAGDPCGNEAAEGIFAAKARTSARDIDVGPDGSIYLIEVNRIRRITPSGKIDTIAGSYGATKVDIPDGSPATITRIQAGGALKVAPDGSIYYVDDGLVVRVCMIDTAGRAYTLAGSRPKGEISGDGGPALRAGLGSVHEGIAFNKEGTLFLNEWAYSGGVFKTNLFRIMSPLPVFSVSDIVVPSKDGQLLYKFDVQGAHQETWSAVSGAKLCSFRYDPQGRLTQVVDAFGRATTIERSAYQEPIIDLLHPKNLAARGGEPCRIVAPNGQATETGLDERGNLNKVIKPGGATFRMAYDGDLLTTVTGPRNDVWAFQYGGLETLQGGGDSNQNGGAQANQSGNLGLLRKATDPMGGGMRLGRISGIDPDAGMGVKTVTAMGVATSTTMVEDKSKNSIRTWSAPDGTVSTLVKRPDATYATTSPDGQTTDMEESPDPRCWMTAPYPSRILVKTAGLSSLTSHTRSVVMPDRTRPFEYSQTDRTNVDGRVSSVTMDPANAAGERTIRSRSPLGVTAAMRIDRYGRPLQSTPPGEFYPTHFSYYDAPALILGMPHETWQGSGAEERRSSMAYNALGLLAAATDPLGRKVTYEYNDANQLTTQTLPDGRMVVTGYDASGNVISIAPPGRPAYRFDFNLRNEATTASLPAVGQEPRATTCHFDLDRRLDYVTLPSGRGLRTHFDLAGRADAIITSETVYRSAFSPDTGKLVSHGDGTTTYTNAYKGALLYSVSLDGPVGGRITSAYGAGFRVTAAHLFDGQSTYSLGLDYNDDSQLTSIGALRLGYDPDSGAMTSSTLSDDGRAISSTVLERSGFGEVTHLKVTRSGSTLYGADFAYDKLGLITSMTQALGGSAAPRRFFYDLGGRLRAVHDGVTTVSTYTYDSNGNRLSRWAYGQGTESASYDERDRLAWYGAAHYAYDADGALTTRTQGGARTVYGYDAMGNLKRVDLPDGRRVDYVLSPAGERIGRKMNGAWTNRFFYGAGVAPVAELDGAGRLKTRFVYAAQTHVPDAMITYSGGVQTGVYRLICDQVGSVRLVVRVSDGVIAQRLDYDEFGRVFFDSNPGFQPFGFAGGLWDADTGLVHMGAREYDPQTGRFTASDPAGFAGGLNLYGYVLADPVNLIDPEGLGAEAKDWLGNFASGGYDGYCGFIDACIPGQWTDPDNPYQQFGQRTGEWTLFVESFLPLFVAPPVGEGVVLYSRGAPAAATAAERVATAAQMGREGEAVAGIVKNTKRIESLAGTANYRIPDVLNATTIGEVKNVAKLAYTSQLKSYSLYAQKYGLRFELYVRKNTILNGPLQQAIANGLITLIRNLP